MGETQGSYGWQRVSNDAVWRHTKIVFLGSLLAFLINVALGFGNVITSGEIPRWQILTHLHGGTIGWLTLTAVGFTIWLFTGDRAVSDSYERRIGWLSWAAVVFGLGYVSSFGISFSLTGNAFALLPIFGTGMMLVIWATALLAGTQLRKQPVLRTPHLLVAGGFLVASFGAIMGVLLGLQYALGSLPLPAGIPNASNHAGPMDAYAVIMGTALVEWLVDRADVRAWRWHGALQAGLFTLAGLMAFVPIEAVSGIGTIIGLLGGSFIFFVRMGWRAVLRNPLNFNESTWATFAPLWLLTFIVGVLSSNAGIVPTDTWLGPVIFHAYFVGFLTNSLFGMLSGRTRDARLLHNWAERGAFWLINVGLLLFAATEIGYGGRHGAIVMGLGVLLGVVVIGYRLLGE
jgi:hypothetical protein